jgi:hypothetical protein
MLPRLAHGQHMKRRRRMDLPLLPIPRLQQFVEKRT